MAPPYGIRQYNLRRPWGSSEGASPLPTAGRLSDGGLGVSPRIRNVPGRAGGKNSAYATAATPTPPTRTMPLTRKAAGFIPQNWI